MWRDYSDITDKLGPPTWWDDNGTPRYGEFHPNVATVYDPYVAYLEIACQACHKLFRVAVSRPVGQHLLNEWCETRLPTADDIGSFHYEDAPRHPYNDASTCNDCEGDTMNVETLKVLEFWECVDPSLAPDGSCWKRRTELEYTYGREGTDRTG